MLFRLFLVVDVVILSATSVRAANRSERNVVFQFGKLECIAGPDI